MSWNNRIIEIDDRKGSAGTYFQLCEVFYDDNGVPHGYAPVDDLVGDSPEDVRGLIDLIHKDIHREELSEILIASEL